VIIYPNYKSFRIRRILNITPELMKILKAFGLKFNYFDIEVISTDEVKKMSSNKKGLNFKEKNKK